MRHYTRQSRYTVYHSRKYKLVVTNQFRGGKFIFNNKNLDKGAKKIEVLTFKIFAWYQKLSTDTQEKIFIVCVDVDIKLFVKPKL